MSDTTSWITFENDARAAHAKEVAVENRAEETCNDPDNHNLWLQSSHGKGQILPSIYSARGRLGAKRVWVR